MSAVPVLTCPCVSALPVLTRPCASALPVLTCPCGSAEACYHSSEVRLPSCVHVYFAAAESADNRAARLLHKPLDQCAREDGRDGTGLIASCGLSVPRGWSEGSHW